MDNQLIPEFYDSCLNLITDEIIQNASIESIDLLNRRLAQELSYRLGKTFMMELNEWRQKNRYRRFNFRFESIPEGWLATLTAHDEYGYRYFVWDSIQRTEDNAFKLKKSIKEKLAEAVLQRITYYQ